MTCSLRTVSLAILRYTRQNPRHGLCCGMRVFSPQPGTKAEAHPAKELWNEGVLATAK
ncbi:hypothetical protein BGX26_007984, partial [Mortierella sp. AD094]